MKINNLLNDISNEMISISEHGFANSYDPSFLFSDFSKQLNDFGMIKGEQLCLSVSEYLIQSNHNINLEAIETFATLWKYINICRDKIGILPYSKVFRKLNLIFLYTYEEISNSCFY